MDDGGRKGNQNKEDIQILEVPGLFRTLGTTAVAGNLSRMEVGMEIGRRGPEASMNHVHIFVTCTAFLFLGANRSQFSNQLEHLNESLRYFSI
jgi:hypothetical protein